MRPSYNMPHYGSRLSIWLSMSIRKLEKQKKPKVKIVELQTAVEDDAYLA